MEAHPQGGQGIDIDEAARLGALKATRRGRLDRLAFHDPSGGGAECGIVAAGVAADGHVYVLVAYAAGHLIAAAGNAIEWTVWKCRGGMPSDWITHDDPKIVNEQQVTQVAARIRSRLGLQIEAIKGMPRRDWAPFFGQIYREVLTHNPGRVHTFNGKYGLNRGLGAALVCLAVIVAMIEPAEWRIAILLLAVGACYVFRMHRFGVHFGKEVYHRFLSLPAEPQRRPIKKGRENEDA